MLVSMKEVEPFSVYTVDHNQVELFTKHFTGEESFSLNLDGAPKSMMIYSLKYNYPYRSFAYAYLLSVDIEQFRSVCSSGKYESMKSIMNEYVLGSVELAFDGDMKGVTVKAMPLNS